MAFCWFSKWEDAIPACHFSFFVQYLTHINTRITKYGKKKKKHVQKSTCTFLFLFFFLIPRFESFFLIVLNEFWKWECFKICSSYQRRCGGGGQNQLVTNTILSKSSVLISMYIAITESRKRKKKTKGNIGSLDPFHNQCLLIMNIYVFFSSFLPQQHTNQTNKWNHLQALYIIIHARTLQFCYKGFKYAAVPSHCQKTM